MLPLNQLSADAAASCAVRDGVFGLTLSSEITVAASPARIWAVLTDFPAYGMWNRTIPAIQGEPIAGTSLRVIIEWPDLRRGNYRLVVLAAKAQQELRWLGRFGFPGLMDGDHRFLLEANKTGGTKVVQVENFSGALVPCFAPWLRDNVLRGFAQMNQALKVRAESMP